MKTLFLSLLSICALVAAEPAKAPAEGHAGRLLEASGVKAEFLIKPDRHVALTFLDAAGKPMARGERSVVVKVDGKDLALEPKPEGFVSKEPLAAKEPAPIVVQVRTTADDKPKNFRLTLNTAICGECKRAEYACTCAH
ncbi:MAG: hypothetical protein RLZ85_1307 [Verrucomicrobiota bacterium]|jgi:hypothetical protein